MSTVHIVGAGVAGLAAAVRLADAGRQVILHESSGHAGGRCRSFHDSALGCTIDNGNHLLLSGNRSARAFLEEIGAGDTLAGPPDARFPFVDVTSGERWTVHLGASRIPWWLLRKENRPPGTGIVDFLSILKLSRAAPDATVDSLFGRNGAFFSRFLEPLAVAALNTPLDRAAAAPLWQVFRETFGHGGAACRPMIARDGLSDSFVTPALDHLRARGGDIRFNRRLKAVVTEAERAVRLDFTDGAIILSPKNALVLAIPPSGLNAVFPHIPVPQGSHAIVNVHFRLSRPPAFADETPILGILGGVAEWLFLRGPIVSVTVSAADALADLPADEIAERVWRDIGQALDIAEAMPPYRVVKERRATFSQTPDAMRLRPGTRTGFANLFLAGDWTYTGLPATIESAIRSGHKAAAAILAVP